MRRFANALLITVMLAMVLLLTQGWSSVSPAISFRPSLPILERQNVLGLH